MIRFKSSPHGIAYPGAKSTRVASSPVRFVYLGGLSWQKGVHVVVEAFQGLVVKPNCGSLGMNPLILGTPSAA